MDAYVRWMAALVVARSDARARAQWQMHMLVPCMVEVMSCPINSVGLLLACAGAPAGMFVWAVTGRAHVPRFSSDACGRARLMSEIRLQTQLRRVEHGEMLHER
ncbi:hypothetical protein GW17_00020852 [Ensete ventricosum]|nr:hypothetical protein GW17_00020852 [Ensete ventricosum]